MLQINTTITERKRKAYGKKFYRDGHKVAHPREWLCSRKVPVTTLFSWSNAYEVECERPFSIPAKKRRLISN